MFSFGLEKPLNQTQTSTYFNQNKSKKYHININNFIFNYKTIFNQSKNKKIKQNNNNNKIMDPNLFFWHGQIANSSSLNSPLLTNFHSH
jgi:hypothetical protein